MKMTKKQVADCIVETIEFAEAALISAVRQMKESGVPGAFHRAGVLEEIRMKLKANAELYRKAPETLEELE